ncbi:hypothetical protein [Stieleria varia]|nr:hypothetical protein [Stieleria varia]
MPQASRQASGLGVNTKLIAILLTTLTLLAPGNLPSANAAPVPAVSTSVAKAVAKFFGKEGVEEASEFLAKKGGRELVERVSSAAAREGGEEAVEQVALLTSKYGPEALAALDNAPSIAPLLSAVSELSETQAKSALARLAAGTTGKELAETVVKHGSSALRSELLHPGVGGMLVRVFGEEGAELATSLTSKQAIAMGRHADELAQLPITQRNGILSLMRNDAERMVGFMGRFVEANPGKTLFTAATTTVILAEPDRILGGEEIVFDADGNPIVVSKSGIAGRTLQAGGEAVAHASTNYLRPLFLTVLAFISVFATLWIALKLMHINRREKLKTAMLQEKTTKHLE